jgi:hypothetical protein
VLFSQKWQAKLRATRPLLDPLLSLPKAHSQGFSSSIIITKTEVGVIAQDHECFTLTLLRSSLPNAQVLFVFMLSSAVRKQDECIKPKQHESKVSHVSFGGCSLESFS